MKFEYFKHPEKFAFFVEEPTGCSVCGTVDLCFDAGGYSGVNTIDCICYECLKSGKLLELDIEANINFDAGTEAANTISYKTPSFPTWQDTPWPMIEGEYPVFECIASVEDFKDKAEFMDSFIETDQTKAEIEWLWDCLPKKKLHSYKDGGDISVYLFSLNAEKYWVWDAN